MAILNALPAHIALLNSEGRILAVNDAWKSFAQANGLRLPDSGVGSNYLEVCEHTPGPRAAQAKEAAEGIRSVLQGILSVFNLEYPCHSRTAQRWFRLMVAPLRGGGAVTMHINITERKLNELAAIESEERFRTTFELAPVGIMQVAPNGRFLRVNQKLCGITGYSREELLEMTFLDLTLAEDRAAGDEQRRKMLDGGMAVYAVEKQYRAKDGLVFWVSLVTTLLRDAAGAPKYFISIIEDISPRKLAEERLRQQKSLLRMAGQISRLGAWTVSLPDYEVVWSDEVRRIHEAENDFAPVAGDWLGYYEEPHREALRKAFEQCVQDGASFDLELEMTTAKRHQVWVRCLGEAVRDEESRVIRVQGALQDISDRKQGELELSRINRALKMLSGCTEKLIRAGSERELLEEVCRIAVETGGYRMVWVGGAEDADTQGITPLAHAGEESGYLSEIKLTWSEQHPSGLGPAGQTIRSGKPVVCPDIGHESSNFHWLAAARDRGYRGVICLPLRDRERTFGLIGLYSGEVLRIGTDEVSLLQDLADDLAFGLCNLRLREERKRMGDMMLSVAASVSAASSEEFIAGLVRNLGRVLQAKGAFVARFSTSAPHSARVIAAAVDGELVENFDYAIEGGPCEQLLEVDEFVVPSGLPARFATVPFLTALGAQGYVGRRLTSSTGQPLGLLFVVFSEPLREADLITSTLRIFAARVTSELERQDTDVQVREQAELLDVAHEAIQVKDLEDRIIYWNKGAERLYGWSAAEAMGRRSTELFLHDAEQLRRAHEILMQTGKWHGEMAKRDKERRKLVVEVSWTLVRDSAGRPKSVLAINQDVTEKKKLEIQFMRAQRMESIGTLAGGIAHDLNNVLAPILMSIEMLQMGLDPETTASVLGTLKTSAQRGADLVKQVLSFARGIEGQRLRVDPLHLLREIEKIVHDTFPKNITFSLVPSRGTWTVTGDPTQLHQVMMNLCVNARDAMPDGGRLTVTLENAVIDEVYAGMNPESRVGSYLLIKVVDTGVGIPPEIREKIFEPFFTTKEVGKGTGLGLSTTLAIVKSHGGFINLYSEWGSGTTFKVYLPANTDVLEARAAVSGTSPLPRGLGELILVVDDEEAVRILAKKTLETFGYRVLLAKHGAEAVSVYAQNRRDVAVVITDMAMPIMDGPATMMALRSMNPDVLIIGSSGLASNSSVARAVGNRVEHFIPKPYSAETMLRMLEEVLRERRAGRAG